MPVQHREIGDLTFSFFYFQDCSVHVDFYFAPEPKCMSDMDHTFTGVYRVEKIGNFALMEQIENPWAIPCHLEQDR